MKSLKICYLQPSDWLVKGFQRKISNSESDCTCRKDQACFTQPHQGVIKLWFRIRQEQKLHLRIPHILFPSPLPLLQVSFLKSREVDFLYRVFSSQVPNDFSQKNKLLSYSLNATNFFPDLQDQHETFPTWLPVYLIPNCGIETNILCSFIPPNDLAYIEYSLWVIFIMVSVWEKLLLWFHPLSSDAKTLSIICPKLFHGFLQWSLFYNFY